MAFIYPDRTEKPSLHFVEAGEEGTGFEEIDVLFDSGVSVSFADFTVAGYASGGITVAFEATSFVTGNTPPPFSSVPDALSDLYSLGSDQERTLRIRVDPSTPSGWEDEFATLEYESLLAVQYEDHQNVKQNWGTVSIYDLDPGNPAFNASNIILENISATSITGNQWYFFPYSIAQENPALVFVFESFDGQKQTNSYLSSEFSATQQISDTSTDQGFVTVIAGGGLTTLSKWVFRAIDPFRNHLTSHLISGSPLENELQGLSLGLSSTYNLSVLGASAQPNKEIPFVSGTDYQDGSTSNQTWGWYGQHRAEFVLLLQDAIDGVNDYYNDQITSLDVGVLYEGREEICATETDTVNCFYKHQASAPFYANAFESDPPNRRKFFQAYNHSLSNADLTAFESVSLPNRAAETVGADRVFDMQVLYKNGVLVSALTGGSVNGTITAYQTGSPANVTIPETSLREVAIGRGDTLQAAFDPCDIFGPYAQITIVITPDNPDDFDAAQLDITTATVPIDTAATDGQTYRSFYVISVSLQPCETTESQRLFLSVGNSLDLSEELKIPKEIIEYKSSKKGQELLLCLFNAYEKGNKEQVCYYREAFNQYKKVAIIKALTADKILKGEYSSYSQIESDFCLLALQEKVRCYGIDVKQEIMSIPEYQKIKGQ